jgi:hypothetical protein
MTSPLRGENEFAFSSPRARGEDDLRANGQSRVHARDALLPEVAGPMTSSATQIG